LAHIRCYAEPRRQQMPESDGDERIPKADDKPAKELKNFER